MEFFENTITLSLEAWILILDFRALLTPQAKKTRRQKRQEEFNALYKKKKLDDLDSKLDRLG